MLRSVAVAVTVLVGAVLTFLLFQPVGTEAQFAIGIITLLLMLAIRSLDSQGLFRQLFMVAGVVLIGRYVYWRATTTLPSTAQVPDFIFGSLLFAAEMFCILLFALNLFVIMRPLKRPPAPRPRPDDAPSVDVFVPSLNESVDLLAATLASARRMDYPADKLTVYLLDDGGTDEKLADPDPAIAEAAAERRRTLQALCADLDVVYLTRERNVSAKAGNLTNGLAQSRGELVAIFDADHAPSRDFLMKTVGHFAGEEKLFLVQTPHAFLNPDPIERNLSTFSRMPSENEMFYAVIQNGLDKWNAAFFCGSAAVVRRAALEEAGGFSGTSITEDCETALDLHARGWKSAYVDEPLIAGLQPDTLAAFIGQRSRWCRGMLQILIMKNPLFVRGLTAAQRICYLSSAMFWLFPIPRAVFLISPLLYIFFGLQIYDATVQDFVAYTLVYLGAAVTMQSYAYGRFRWPWISELYEYVQTVYLLPAIASVVVNPRRPKFNVTAKGVTIEDDVLSGLAWPYFLIFGVLAAGVVVTGVRLQTEPDASGLLTIVGAWNLFNLVIAAIALGVVSERRERRSRQRVPASRKARFEAGIAPVQVMLEDVSLGGVRFRPLGPVKDAATLQGAGAIVLTSDGSLAETTLPVRIANVQTVAGRRVYGAAFETLSARDYMAIAGLMYADLGPLEAFQATRRRARGILLTAARMAVWSLRETWRGFVYALAKRAPKTRGEAA
ncbi:UDP-forming cellulose synthase catalytic subunit [Salinarimonas sp.]|uniref:UDP-forming cellulose synthase catalytic subunit n=1 Tax=Salinarimonas sp. TaxID=2766526 RepID=UPI0032D8FFE1